MIIAFYNRNDELTETVTIEGNKMTFDNDPSTTVEKTPEEIQQFIDEFGSWSNGYNTSITVPDGEQPAKKLVHESVDESYTAEDLQKVREKYYASEQ